MFFLLLTKEFMESKSQSQLNRSLRVNDFFRASRLFSYSNQ